MSPEQKIGFSLSAFPMQEILNYAGRNGGVLPRSSEKYNGYVNTIAEWIAALEISKVGEPNPHEQHTIDESRSNSGAIAMYSFFRRFMPSHIEECKEEEAYGCFVDSCVEALGNLVNPVKDFDKKKTRVFEKLVSDIYGSKGL